MRFYQYIAILSLDVVLGACAMASMFAEVLQVQMPWSVYTALGLGVWLVYTLDHLLDAREVGKKAITPRHSFHVRHFRSLVMVWGGVLLVSLPVIFFYLPAETIRWGMWIIGFSGVHLALVKLVGSKVSLFVQKELSVATVYSLGVAVGPFSLSESYSPMFFLLLLQVFVFGMINLLELSYFEVRADSSQGQASLSQRLGMKRTGRLVKVFIALEVSLVVLGLLLFTESLWKAEIAMLIGTLMFLFIFVHQRRFAKNEAYRLLGDLCFSFPLLIHLF